MKRTALILAALLLTTNLVFGEMESEDSSWVLSVGGAAGSDSGALTTGGGWYVGLETPALASSWTVAFNYQDLGARFGQVGARRYVGSRSTWFWFGFGVGVAKLDIDYTDYAPGGFVEAGLSWELTEHISIELAGDVGGWHVTDFESVTPRGRAYYYQPADSWEVLPKMRLGVGFVF